MRWISRLSLQYLLFPVLVFWPLTIMLIDLLACWMGRWGCLSLVEEVGLARHDGPPAVAHHVAGRRGDCQDLIDGF
jgi:hypothetical protein